MTTTERPLEHQTQQLDRVTIRFAGDSGDGMQLTGTQFTRTAAVFGNDISTLPDFPAEIRAPAGSLPGVSGFQLSFSSTDIHTPGDAPDVLVAMNPAALKTNIGDLPAGGALIVNSDAFTQQNLNKAGYATNPLSDGSLKQYTVFEVPITTLNERALDGLDMTSKQVDLTKNFFALGPDVLAVRAEHGPDAELDRRRSSRRGPVDRRGEQARAQGRLRLRRDDRDVPHDATASRRPSSRPGTYRNITGNEATALGFVAASKLAKRHLFYGSYPITPASDILHQLSGVQELRRQDVPGRGRDRGHRRGDRRELRRRAGHDRQLRPGHRAQERGASGLAVMVELPLVVVDVQRAGPSTGMPTKTEQADLLQVMFGRNSDSPMPVVAPATPGECFDFAIEAWRLALKYMTPVVYLSDAFLATGAEPWKIPDARPTCPDIAVPERGPRATALPALRPRPRDARPAVGRAGHPGLEHRIGGLEKADITGNVSYDPDNHHRMQLLRQARSPASPRTSRRSRSSGRPRASCCILGWGSTYGAIRSAVERLQAAGPRRSRTPTCATSTRSRPTPRRCCGATAACWSPRSTWASCRCCSGRSFLIDAVGYNRVRGKPFRIARDRGEAERMPQRPSDRR